MVKIYVLIEQAIGYGLLKAKNCKSTDDLLNVLKERDIKNLSSQMQLVEFQPFSSAANAAMNCVDIANGVVSEDLSKLLKAHLSAEKAILVVNDKKLIESLKAAAIGPELTFTADNSLVFNLREVRHHFHVLLNDDEGHLVKAHIGLGHGYSRIKIKYNVNRSDNMIIQTINLLDQIDKDINTMAMRLREWFGYHYPELFKIAPDYRSYARVVQLIKSRSGAVEANVDQLEAILQDSAKARMVVDTAKTSMGYELTEEDFINIAAFADKILLMIEQRDFTVKYLNTKMGQVAPNFSTLVGDIVAARLISHAGSLINLAKFPASTIQILGAEKALFRAIKTRGNTPKYGLIFHSSFIGRAAKADKGRISRFLAAKISLAVRLDCFMDEPISIYGQHLRRHVEDQLTYLETGKEPQKNYEMMDAAVKEAKAFVCELRKEKERKAAEEEVTVKTQEAEGASEAAGKKKNKKRKAEEIAKTEPILAVLVKQDAQIAQAPKEEAQLAEPQKKKKKKNKDKPVEETAVKVEVVTEAAVEAGGKKKKMKKEKTAEAIIEAPAVVSTDGEPKKKKMKKEKVADVVAVPEKTPKKEKSNATEEVKPESSTADNCQDSPKKKKKTKKNKVLN